MSVFDSLTGGAYNTAYKNNLATINTGLTRQSTALGDNYTSANNYILGSGIPALQAGYGAGGQLLATGYGNQRVDINQGAQNGMGQLGANYGQAADAITGNYGSALSALGQGYGQSRDDLTSGYGQARDDITMNYGRARTDLGNQYAQTQGYFGAATAAYDPLISGSQGAFTGFMDATGANGAAGSDRATANFRAAPGYQYMLDQALGAVQRSAAARGGLAGGNATADILKTANGLADQSYQQYVGNLQAGANYYQTGIQGRAAGLTNQGNASQAYGTQLGNLGMAQGNVLAGLSTGLADRLSANDTSLGTARANIYGQQGGALGSLYQGLGNQLLGSQTNLGLNLGQANANLGTGQSALSVGQGTGLYGAYNQIGSNLMNLGNQESAAIQNATSQYVAQNNQKAKAQTEAGANMLGSITGFLNSPLAGAVGKGLGSLFG